MKKGKSVILIAGAFLITPVSVNAEADKSLPDLLENQYTSPHSHKKIYQKLLLLNPFALIHRWDKLKKPLQSLKKDLPREDSGDFIQGLQDDRAGKAPLRGEQSKLR